MEKVIDAKNKSLGRVATEAAMALMGKDKAGYRPNVTPTQTVHITNASQANINEKKRGEKIYKRFTGYPSGLKTRTLDEVIVKKGYGEVFEKAIYGMLPNNKLRKIMMKNLKVTE